MKYFCPFFVVVLSARVFVAAIWDTKMAFHFLWANMQALECPQNEEHDFISK